MNDRPELKIITPNASVEESAAIAAALGQFIRQTAPATVTAGPSIPAWQRASLAEGVAREFSSPVEQFGFPA